MTTSEKVAYLKGLAEGMGIQEDGGQGKLFHVIIDILEDLSLDLADTKDALVDLTDGVEEINEDLAELENEFYESPCSCCGGDDEDEEYDDEDEDDTVFYSVECPGCGFKLTVDEDTLNAGSFECPECGEVIDFENAAVEEVVFDDEDDEDEKDCVQLPTISRREVPSGCFFLQCGAVPRFSSGQKTVQLPCGISQMLHDPLLLREDAFRRAGDTDGILCAFPRLRKDRHAERGNAGLIHLVVEHIPFPADRGDLLHELRRGKNERTAPLFKYDRIAVIPYILVRLRGEDGKTGAAQMQKQQ